MLRKLMKHEFRATSRIMLPLYLILLVTAVGAKFSVSDMFETENTLLNILGGLLVVAFAVSMAAVCLVSVFLMVQRFYQNLLRDEGYVMMTLPVSIHQQVWAKLLVGVAWCAVTVLAVCLAIFVMGYQVGLLEEFGRFAGEVWQYVCAEFGLDGLLTVLEVLVVCFATVCSMYLEFYAALAVGHSFPNHKLIWSVGAYFAMEFVMSLIVGTAGSVLGAAGILDNLVTLPNDSTAALHVALLGTAAASVLNGAVYYAITAWFLKHKLNLE